MGMLKNALNSWFSGGLYNDEGEYDEEDEGEEEGEDDEEDEDNEDPYGEDSDPNQEQDVGAEEGQEEGQEEGEKEEKDKKGKDKEEKAQVKGEAQGKKKKPNVLKMKAIAKSLSLGPYFSKVPCPVCKQLSLFYEKPPVTMIRIGKLIVQAIVGSVNVDSVLSSVRFCCMNPKCKSYYKPTGDKLGLSEAGQLRVIKNYFHIVT